MAAVAVVVVVGFGVAGAEGVGRRLTGGPGLGAEFLGSGEMTRLFDIDIIRCLNEAEN